MKIRLLLPLLLSVQSNVNALEVLHWWTSPGELEAQKVLKDELIKQAVHWQDFAIVGGGGDSAMRVLQMRALSGNPPDAAQIKGPDIAEWAKMGMLKKVDYIVPSPVWRQNLSNIVKKTVSYNGYYMALPLNIHRVNWLWLNKEIFEELALEIPTTWQQFFIVADKIKMAGYIPLAHGRTNWQNSVLFESVVLSLLGATRYRQAFVEFDESVLISPEMLDAFKMFKRLNDYISDDSHGEDWTFSGRMLIDKQAAMLFMGDWVKGMWSASGVVAMQDYLCVDVPQNNDVFSYNIDSFVFFNKYNKKNATITDLNYETFAKTLLSSDFQHDFNIKKGSIPVRMNMDMQGFDECSQKAYFDFYHRELVPSFSQNMATTSHLQSEMSKIISHYFNNPSITAEQAMKQLSVTIRAVNK